MFFIMNSLKIPETYRKIASVIIEKLIHNNIPFNDICDEIAKKSLK